MGEIPYIQSNRTYLIANICLFSQAIDIWMSSGVAFVFLAMIEFALVNTLARKEIRRMSIKVRTEQKDDSGDLVRTCLL